MRMQKGFSAVTGAIVLLSLMLLFFFVIAPWYSSYSLGKRLDEVFKSLRTTSYAATLHWSDKKTYEAFESSPNFPKGNDDFVVTLEDYSESEYRVVATGRGALAGFVYTVNQARERATVKVPAGWKTSAYCWVERKDGGCAD